jgi:ribosome-binding factor A
MKPDRHTLQLCSQVAETLHLLFLDSEDDDLRDLMLLEVVPLAGAGTLLVRVSYPVRKPGDVARVQHKLSEAAKAIRAEVTAAITRRRAPELAFQVVPAGQG